MDYAQISKETISHLYKSYNSLKQSPLDAEIRVLVELRTSQINGCAYCCQLHTAEARKENISQDKLDVLPAWRSSSLFSAKERIALQWVEEITRLNACAHKTKAKLLESFSEREVVDLTACVSIMNALNRMAISLRD
jgi:AhpD family alkylhydroperoxidase